MKRRLPSRHDLAPLMQFKKPEFDAKKRRLDKALTIYDLRAIAKRRTPRGAFDYADGAAERSCPSRARQAFEDIEFHPSILRDVSLSTSGMCWVHPLPSPSGSPDGLCPDDAHRRRARGRSRCRRAGIPFALSTVGTTSIEDVKAANVNGRNWFQLYMWRDRDRSMSLLDRAAACDTTRC